MDVFYLNWVYCPDDIHCGSAWWLQMLRCQIGTEPLATTIRIQFTLIHIYLYIYIIYIYIHTHKFLIDSSIETLWLICRHWRHWKLSFWQHPVQPVMKFRQYDGLCKNGVENLVVSVLGTTKRSIVWHCSFTFAISKCRWYKEKRIRHMH